MLALGDFAGRFAGLVGLAILPWALPLDVPPPEDGTAASLRIALAVAIVAGSSVLLRAAAARSRPSAAALAAPLAAAALGAALHDPVAGPVGAALGFVAPVAWLGLATAALVSRMPRHRDVGSALRAGAPRALAVLAVGAGSLALAWPRLASEDGVLRAMLASDPANERAAAWLAERADARGEHDQARDVLTACGNAGGCACVVAVAERDLAERAALAVAWLQSHRTACSAAPGYEGLAADALARAGRLGEARAIAGRVLDRDAADRHAMFALALAAQGSPDAARAAERADAAGYGDDATLLVGIADLDGGNPARAAESFRRVLARSPRHARATYDLALASDRLGRYNDAREGYLAALRIDPSYADARYNLALLTYHAGALPEARHHLEELARIAPTDPRLDALRRALDASRPATPPSPSSP